MFWLPPVTVVCFFLGRLFELKHRFPATTGHVESPRTLHALTAIASVTVVASLGEYFIVRPAPSMVLVGFSIGLAICAFALRAASRRSLGKMWSVHIEIRPQHALVESGPYRFVRHPIYVAAIIELVAVPIVLGAFRTGLLGVAAYAGAIAWRVRREEAAMERSIGYEWRAYRQRTGAFVPKW